MDMARHAALLTTSPERIRCSPTGRGSDKSTQESFAPEREPSSSVPSHRARASCLRRQRSAHRRGWLS
ncbi:hypothetical protein BD289DRAFT_428220 [Coniella lustricola]|uniref:Uncharacterized protein n=1 Tax=Coniella lustricola TaxID=2025994 RepID=A0A2T3AEK8_9PEZI|nr:hypothetical protein BD289DRAFT_428220 [Coniella lustricola]